LFRYGRIAGIDKFGVRGDYSEIFEIEQRIVEKKTATVNLLPSNYLPQNHLITLDFSEDKTKKLFTYYKINDGKWLTYQGGIRLSKEGLNLIQYYSEDKLGNRERIKTKDYILDTEAPHVEMVITNTYQDKEKFVYTGKNSKIEIKVSDLYSGVLSVKTYLRTVNESIEMDWITKQEISIPNNFSEKVVELVVIAADRLGNIKKYSKFFKHDLVPPELMVETISQIDGTARRISVNRISAYDSYSGVRSIFYSLNNSSPQTYFEPILIFEPGEYELKIQAIDNAGNKSAFRYERILVPEPAKKKISANNKNKAN
jgi:hypothetical protein